MKGITMCADCAYYNMKKHKCTRGCKIDPDVSKGENPSFYVDCPLPDVEPLQKWIPCNERLPEHYDEILFCERDRTMHKGYMYWDGTFIENHVKFQKSDIVAWMPMPDVYEPPEKE